MGTAFEITVNGKPYTVEVGDLAASPLQVTVNGIPKTVIWKSEATGEREQAQTPPTPESPAPVSAPAPAEELARAPEQPPVEGRTIEAPMPGKILSIRVSVGDQVKEGDVVCTLEAMKMEMPISATFGGKVTAIPIQIGQNVSYGDPLVILS